MKMPEPEVKADFEMCPAGAHLAVCYQVIDLGTQLTNYQGKEKQQRKVFIGWELPNELMEDGRPFVVGKRYTFSSYERATLRMHLESWRGSKFSDDEISGFNIRNLLGVRGACLASSTTSQTVVIGRMPTSME